MSYSLRLENGDLALNTTRAYETVSGKDKLFQDLQLWILERIGTDPATPTFGSTLDGGIINGNEVPSFIGQIASQHNLNLIKSEVISLLGLYQQTQSAKIQRDLIQYNGKQTLTADEILGDILSVNVAQQATLVIVKVLCNTLSGSQFNLTIPLQI